MGVDRRSIRRDIERLRELGYPVTPRQGGRRLPARGGGAGIADAAGRGQPPWPSPCVPRLRPSPASTTLRGACCPARPAGADPPPAGREVRAATATLADLPSTDARLLGRLAHCRRGVAAGLRIPQCAGRGHQREVEAQHLVNYGRRWYLLPGTWGGRTGALSAWTAWVPYVSAPSRACTGARQPPDVMVRQAVSQAPFALQAIVRLAGSRTGWKGASHRGVVCWRLMVPAIACAHGRRAAA